MESELRNQRGAYRAILKYTFAEYLVNIIKRKSIPKYFYEFIRLLFLLSRNNRF